MYLREQDLGSSLLSPQSSSPLQNLSNDIHCPVSQRSSLSLQGFWAFLGNLTFFTGTTIMSEIVSKLSSLTNSSFKSWGLHSFSDNSTIMNRKVLLLKISWKFFKRHIFVSASFSYRLFVCHNILMEFRRLPVTKNILYLTRIFLDVNKNIDFYDLLMSVVSHLTTKKLWLKICQYYEKIMEVAMPFDPNTQSS